MPNESQPILRRMSLRSMLDEATHLTRRSFKQIFPTTAIPVAVASLLLVGAQALNPAFKGFSDEMQPVELILFPLLMLGAAFLYGLVFGLCSVTIQVAATAVVTGHQLDLGQCWRFTFRARVLGTLFLVWFAVGIGLLLCLIPGVIVMVLFGLCIPVMYAEDLYGLAALDRARALISLNPEGGFANHPALRLFGIGLVGYLLSYVASFAVQLPFAAVQWFVMFRSIPDAETGSTGLPMAWLWLQIPQNALGALATIAIFIYVNFAVALLYRDVRGARDGTDLHEALDGLGAPRLIGSQVAE